MGFYGSVYETSRVTAAFNKPHCCVSLSQFFWIISHCQFSLKASSADEISPLKSVDRKVCELFKAVTAPFHRGCVSPDFSCFEYYFLQNCDQHILNFSHVPSMGFLGRYLSDAII